MLSRPIELIPIDTASQVSRTTNELEGALERYPNATAGIGHTDSTYALDGRVFQKAGIRFITPGATAPDLPHQVGRCGLKIDDGVKTLVWTWMPQSQ
ncbi:hypothetical protein [Methyloceanibacter sp.]|uniref:hypothetical protein n=1 Tax=Methyloceanibacter sp. TaxID=1965321 RepID=UPI003C786E5B